MTLRKKEILAMGITIGVNKHFSEIIESDIFGKKISCILFILKF